MPVLEAEAVKTPSAAARRIGKLAGAALISASLSTVIAAFFRNSIGRMTSHVIFIIVVVAIGLLMHWTGHAIDRLDAGLVFMLFLFEPLGRVLLHLEPAPANALLVLPLAMIAAYFFGHENSAADSQD